MTVRPSPALGRLSAYGVPPVPPGVDLRLDGNEGARPPAAELLAEVAGLGPDLLRRYPEAQPLEEELGRRLGVKVSQVLVTAGGDEALDRICRVCLSAGGAARREAIVPSPTFEMLLHYARLAGADLVSVAWPSGDLPAAEMAARVTERTGLVAVVSPNNPTGAVASSAQLATLSAAAPAAILLVDLAYVEFADEDLTNAALALPNAVVVRTFSKAWGLAGLRVGYAVGSEEVMGWMRAAGGPYAVSRLSLEIARRCLGRQREVDAFVARVREERRALFDLLGELGAEPRPSQANFVLARFRDARAVRERLLDRKIAVRIFPGRPELDGMLRITCPGEARSFSRLESALRDVLGGKR